MRDQIAIGIMSTPQWIIFRLWQMRAYEICVELCGSAPDEMPVEAWALYFDDGLSPSEAGSIVAGLIT